MLEFLQVNKWIVEVTVSNQAGGLFLRGKLQDEEGKRTSINIRGFSGISWAEFYLANQYNFYS